MAAGTRLLMMTALSAAALLASPASAGQARWSFEMHAGSPVIPERRVTVTQAGYPDLVFDGKFRSDAFDMPYYYDFRVLRWRDRTAWALDFHHAKLILSNNPPEVQDLQFTHGYNMVSLQRLWDRGPFVLMAGAGVVVTHAESTIRGRVFNQHEGLFGWGYYVSGPLAVVGIGRRVDLGGRFYLSGDLRVSLSAVDVPVVDGRARLRDVGYHFLAGAGVHF